MTANNTYAGNTTIAAGTLQLGDGGLTGSVTSTLIDTSVLVINHSNTFTLPGVISGGGLLRQVGTGTTILAADNTYFGTTTIIAGTLQLGNAGATGSFGKGDRPRRLHPLRQPLQRSHDFQRYLRRRPTPPTRRRHHHSHR